MWGRPPTRLFLKELFRTAKNLETTQISIREEWISKLWCGLIVGHFPATKVNELLIYATSWKTIT